MSYIDDYIGQYTYDYKKTYPVLSIMEHHHHITMMNEDNNRYRETAYHHYIACKDYDKAITRKIQSAINSSMIHSKQNGDDSKAIKRLIQEGERNTIEELKYLEEKHRNE